jgi:Kdo2-lipid IVA lauroyltransferase/acyltransferase
MWLIRATQGLVWVLSLPPYSWIRRLALPLGLLAWYCAGERRRITLINLRLCFPEWSETKRKQVAKSHFVAFMTSILSIGMQWYASRQRLQDAVRLVDLHHWEAVREHPVILMAPHFMGLDVTGIRISSEFPLIAIYGKHKNPQIDRLIFSYRTRFSGGFLYSRQQGLRQVIRDLKAPRAFYYLPDLDFGAKESIFIPFFGVTAATVPALSRLAKITGAKVVPCVARERSDKKGVEARFYPAWDHFPSDDPVADTIRMNNFIEELIRETPEQYLWSHKRFKTRPPGEPNLYGEDKE